MLDLKILENKSLDDIKPPPKWVDIGGLISVGIFLLLNISLNQYNAFFSHIINFTTVIIATPIILSLSGNINKFRKLQLLIICIAAITLGSVYGGIIGIVGAVSAWPLLTAIRLKISKTMGLAVSFGVFVILVFHTYLWGKLPITESYKWAAGLCVIFTLYLSLSLFFTSFFNRDNNILQHETITNTSDTLNPQAAFIAEMSHEIRTPINAILGFTDTMQEEVFGPLNDRYKEYLGYVHQSGHHLLDLVGDILDMSKIEAGKYNLKFENSDIISLTKDASTIIIANAKRSNITLNFYGHGVINVDCDTRSIRQIVLNLLSNAIKFTPEGGKIDIRVFGNNDKAWIEVTDTGRGISEDELKNIGQPYFSSSEIPNNVRSTGLGLTLVKKLVEFHHGKFAISSKINHGTNVTIELPRVQNI